jgi:flagellar hook-associated protein 3 FlgL
LQYSKSLSDLEDLDYTAALSDLAKQQTIMEAAQKSFVATTGLSLFKFI